MSFYKLILSLNYKFSVVAMVELVGVAVEMTAGMVGVMVLVVSMDMRAEVRTMDRTFDSLPELSW